MAVGAGVGVGVETVDAVVHAELEAVAAVAVGAVRDGMIKLTATLLFAEPDAKENDATGEESIPTLWT